MYIHNVHVQHFCVLIDLCDSDQFKCDSGECIYKKGRCNQYEDFFDGSDEIIIDTVT